MYVLRDTEYGHSADVLSSQSPAVVLKTRSSCSSSLSTLSRHSCSRGVRSASFLAELLVTSQSQVNFTFYTTKLITPETFLPSQSLGEAPKNSNS